MCACMWVVVGAYVRIRGVCLFVCMYVCMYVCLFVPHLHVFLPSEAPARTHLYRHSDPILSLWQGSKVVRQS